MTLEFPVVEFEVRGRNTKGEDFENERTNLRRREIQVGFDGFGDQRWESEPT